MKVVEVSGSASKIGKETGEALREEIAEHLERFPPRIESEDWSSRLPTFLETLREHLPLILEEMEGTAEGANVPLEQILGLNLPLYPNSLVVEDGCTNVAFAGGPNGPLWGKNNDGMSKEQRRPACARKVSRDGCIPLVVFTFCGMIATTDAMNSEGLAMGHSSVGSKFQQSDHFVPIRPWAYECLMHTRTVNEFVHALASRPTRGKGYSVLCVDRQGAVCSIEAPCPIIQVREASEDHGHMNCVNYYQLEALSNADRRNEAGKCNAVARREFLESQLNTLRASGVDAMKTLLRHHGSPSICRHGGEKDQSVTEYSMIGIPDSGKVLCLDGYPCEQEFQEIQL